MQNPRDRRLQADYEKVRKLASESGGTLKLVRISGRPPTSYVIEYHCPGLVKNNAGQIATRNCHQVEISLGSNYPFEKPTARMLTPVFNPHVFSSNAICLGVVWSAAETLDTLILRIGALLQLDPRVLDSRSPANSEANRWVQQNRQRIPIGNVSFRLSQEPKKRIEWS
jgi:ubiquitin-protein ligase